MTGQIGLELHPPMGSPDILSIQEAAKWAVPILGSDSLDMCRINLTKPLDTFVPFHVVREMLPSNETSGCTWVVRRRLCASFFDPFTRYQYNLYNNYILFLSVWIRVSHSACMTFRSTGHVEMWVVCLWLISYPQLPIAPSSVRLDGHLCAQMNSSLMSDDTTCVPSVSQKRWCWWWILCKPFNLRGRIWFHPTNLQL